ncbi:MAG: THUMP domain-containing protein, partial [Thermodesulfovibrionales bacterium]
FQSADEFETQAADAVRGFAPAISGKSFHVRIHRRGFKGRFSSPEVERRLDAALLEVLEREGSTATIRFDDADAIIAIETVSNRAGVSLWSRDSMERYPFIRID